MSTSQGPKWAIVTGAGSGMGRAFAEKFLAKGWGVLAMDLSGEGLGRLHEAYAGREASLIAATLDVTDRAAIADAIDRSGIGGQLSAAVTAAGIFPPTNLLTFTVDHFDRIMGVNVLGTLNVAAEAIRHMRAAGTRGAIVTISSADAFTASTQQLIYSASKAAVVSLTRVLAATVAGDDIIVNGIAPGWVNTPGNAATGRMVGAEKHIPLGRVAQPEEIAEWVWALANREGVSFVTGETIKVTGGELMS
ncbi:SDR family NAD(P)-dependent oxidoreductase [Mesorhizobium escarrei]|uniref:Short-chain dehydrogenase n=1 Tax=Mesorhizobium escarrei TaxID=666018 RepID=A0ABM9DWB6_9HYPH|nr:SDR family oxidoreductase [Mesorhizobium escarrei]CAH2401011.1 Short-chain dehydrogenase [Mesorhizobium escarrei]